MTIESELNKINAQLKTLVGLTATIAGVTLPPSRELPGGGGGSPPQATAKTKPAKTKAVPEGAPEPANSKPAQEPLETCSRVKLVGILTKYRDAYGKEKLIELMVTNFGVRSVGELKEADYARCHQIAKEEVGE